MKFIVSFKYMLTFLLMCSLSACANLSANSQGIQDSSTIAISVVEHPIVDVKFAHITMKGANRFLKFDISASGSRAYLPAGTIQLEYLSETGALLATQTERYAGRHQAVHHWYKAGDKMTVKLNSDWEQAASLRIRYVIN